MLVELSVVEQRYHAVMEVISGGVPVVEVAGAMGIAQDGERVAQRSFLWSWWVICPGRISRRIGNVLSPRNALLAFGESGS